MKILTGVDICSVDRIGRSIERYGERFLERVFTRSEIEYCTPRANQEQSYAARFAAKEAMMKLLGVGMFGVCFSEIEVVSSESGKPSITLAGKAGEIAKRKGIHDCDLSLSHDKGIALAVVVALVEKVD